MHIAKYFIAMSMFLFFGSFMAGVLWGSSGFVWAFTSAALSLGIGVAIIWIQDSGGQL